MIKVKKFGLSKELFITKIRIYLQSSVINIKLKIVRQIRLQIKHFFTYFFNNELNFLTF